MTFLFWARYFFLGLVLLALAALVYAHIRTIRLR
jgi:hypothetical protein